MHVLNKRLHFHMEICIRQRHKSDCYPDGEIDAESVQRSQPLVSPAATISSQHNLLPFPMNQAPDFFKLSVNFVDP